MSEHTSPDPTAETVSLDTYLRVLRERKWLILTIVLLAVGLTVGASLRMTPQYRATAQVLRDTTALDNTLFGTSVFQLQDPQLELQSGANLVKLDAVAQMVKDDLKSPRSLPSLRAMVTVSTVTAYDLIRISAESPDPAEAAAVANSFARQFINYRRQSDQSTLAAARQEVQGQLDRLSPADLASPSGATLIQKREELGILESMQTGGFTLVQAATAPSSPVSPRPVFNAAFALLASLGAALFLAFALNGFDKRLKTPEALEAEFGMPVLASTPRLGRRWIKRGSRRSQAAVAFTDPSPQFKESFRSLRSNLKYFEFDRKIRTIVLTSGLPEEGKTITTANLAWSLALSGARVLVIEADLRRPMLHHYLGLKDVVGLSTVLAGDHPLEGALQAVPTSLTSWRDRNKDQAPAHSSPPTAHVERSFYCLSSGPIPPNPAELVGSQQMAKLVAHAASIADYVLIDTPPVLVVADAVSLFPLVDAVIVCCRVNSTKVDEAREVRKLLERTGAHALGLVAGGVKTSRRHSRSDYGYYVQQGSGHTPPLPARMEALSDPAHRD